MSGFISELQMAGVHRHISSSSSHDFSSKSLLGIEQKVTEISRVTLRKGYTERKTYRSVDYNALKYATEPINETTFKVCF